MATTSKLTFEEWLIQVDFWVGRECGMGREDLPDCCYADWYADGVRPRAAAKRAIKAAKADGY